MSISSSNIRLIRNALEYAISRTGFWIDFFPNLYIYTFMVAIVQSLNRYIETESASDLTAFEDYCYAL